MKSAVLCLVLSLFALKGAESLPFLDDDVTDISARIGGGGSVQITARNFQVAVNACGYVCGGSLIRANFIVTAAHCTVGCTASQITVRAGSVNFATGGSVLNGRRLVQHPDFDRVTRDFDISVLELDGSFPLSGTIGIVNLVEIMPADASALVVSGFGSTTVGGAVPNILMSGTVQLTNFDNCNLQYRDTLNKNMFCAHAATQRACPGDEGGPITFNGNLLGVVSFGTDCAMARIPGVFTSIPAFNGWINQVILQTIP